MYTLTDIYTRFFLEIRSQSPELPKPLTDVLGTLTAGKPNPRRKILGQTIPTFFSARFGFLFVDYRIISGMHRKILQAMR